MTELPHDQFIAQLEKLAYLFLVYIYIYIYLKHAASFSWKN